MRCRVCGGTILSKVTDLPFKTGDTSIVIFKALPVLQCAECGETELEQGTMSRVEEGLARDVPAPPVREQHEVAAGTSD